MSIFQTAEELYQVVQTLFDQLAETPDKSASFSQSNFVLRICLQNPAAEILVDGRQPPLEIFCGERPGEANITLSLEADLLHQFLLGEKELQQMLFNGQIQTKGNMLRAVPVVDLLMACQNVYRKSHN